MDGHDKWNLQLLNGDLHGGPERWIRVVKVDDVRPEFTDGVLDVLTSSL